MQQLGEIRISGGKRLTIDIEGLIGIPQWWTFDDDRERAVTYDNFRSRIDRIGRSGARRVQVNIRSTGGNVNDALLIYDALCALAAEGAEITTSCHGYAASAATVIAQAATPGRRLVSSNALYLIHNSTAAVEGNWLDAERTARLLGKTDERLAQIYAVRSGRPVEQFRELMARDGGRGEWLSATEAVAAGLADRVSHQSPLAAVRDKLAETVGGLFRNPPVPAAPEEVVPVLACLVPQAAADDPERLPEADDLRRCVRASVTQPHEDPAVIPAGMTGEGLGGLGGLGGFGGFGGDFSRNGIAYESDAVRLRTGC